MTRVMKSHAHSPNDDEVPLNYLEESTERIHDKDARRIPLQKC